MTSPGRMYTDNSGRVHDIWWGPFGDPTLNHVGYSQLLKKNVGYSQ